MRPFLPIIAFICCPIVASAQVIVSEIAWMGSNNGNTTTDANDEWIELYNNGSEVVDISGWSLTADDDSPKISLSGSIAPNSFFLLERSDDASVPAVSADLIYTGSLGNAGETLTLKDASGNTIQRIVSGESWAALGGDNATKQTPQWSGSLWVTADPTPKAPLSGTSLSQSAPPPPPSSEQQGSLSPPPPSVSSGYSAPAPRISADAGPDRTVIVGAEAEFKGRAFGLKNEPLAHARFVWNFGDGGTREGAAAVHRYSVPGRYVVALEVSSGEYAGSDRAIVDAVEALLSIGFQKDARSIEIDNGGEYELDISWWIITYQGRQFIVPKNTVVLPKSTLRLSSEMTGFDLSRGGDIVLLYPNGTEATRGSSSPAAPLAVETRSSYAQVPKAAVKVSPKVETEEAGGRMSRRDISSSTLAAQVRESGSAGGDGVSIWYFILGIVLLSAIGIIGLRISRDNTTVHGYTIIKDTRD